MFKGFGRFGGMGAMAAGAFAAAVLALGAWIGSKRGAPEEAAPETVAVLPERDATPENATLVPDAVKGVSVGPEGEAATEPEAAPQAPAFDEVRRESDGMTVIAGRAAPGSTVAVLKDGEEVARATADGAGKFATLAMIPPDGKGHVLTLLGQDGAAELASEEEIILTPRAAPVQLAEADIAPEENPIAPLEEGATQPVEAAEPETSETTMEEPIPATTNDAEEENAAATGQNPAAVEPEQATPLAGRATAEAERAATDNADAQDVEADRGQSTQDEADTDEDIASTEQDPAIAEEEVASAPVQATPLSDTGTADVESRTSEQPSQAMPMAEIGTAEEESAATLDEDGDAGQGAGTGAAPSQARPMAGTGSAEDVSAATVEQDDAAEQGEVTSTTPAQTTPMAETGTAEDMDAAPSEQDGAADQGADTSATPSQATPLAETGTEEEDTAAPNADGEAPSQATPLAETGTAESDATLAQTPPAAVTEAPNLADRSPSAPETTTPAPAEEPDTTAAPAKPPAPAPVLKSTAEGVERLDTAPPQVMTNVALDTIGYSDQGDVQLAGRAQPDTREVRVYLNNNAVISLPVDQEGRWRGDLPNVDEGVYTLRVDELSRAGDVTSRVETPFKRESPEVLAAATEGLTGPLSAVTVQKGDTLWAISRARYGDPLLYVKVFEANSANIRDPDLIYPGQVFDLPEDPASE
ncbi:LysM peptidoglycan-binding domain-containing protein [Sulfitobacter faviae]|uniref:LysM peptidoglycan-binding domain-containing protein n=1 Tax=Sulfitobacter faviae TaxID=1775881 RepID=UPI00398C87CC